MYWNDQYNMSYLKTLRLTLTWDVLKFGTGHMDNSSIGLTLTWDVLKCFKRYGYSAA